MAKILIKDILYELRAENKGLFNENKVIFDLLNKYRKCLLKMSEMCECSHKINNKIITESLEKMYKKCLDQKLQETNETKYNVIQSSNQIKRVDPINDSFEATFNTQTNNLSQNKRTYNKSVNKIKVIETNISEKIIEQKTNPKDSQSVDNSGKQLESDSSHVFKCQICDQTFGNTSELKVHKLSHPQLSGHPLQTSITDIESLKKSLLKSGTIEPKNFAIKLSVSGQTSGHKFVCLYIGCDKSYLSSKNLKLHIWSKHTNHKPFKCEECTKSFITNQKLKTHKKIHSKEDIPYESRGDIVCEFEGCYKRFSRKIDQARHIRRNHTTEKRVECQECLRKFLTEVQLRDHQRIHRKEGTLLCRICNRSFDFYFHLKNHERIAHSSDGVIYKCNNCSFETKIKSLLKAHSTQYHTDISELTVKCDKEGCSKMFKTIEKMTKHRNKVHSGKKFACDWPGCDFVTHVFNGFNNHKQTHIAAKELKCDFEGCSKVFKAAGTLWQHRMRHLKKYVCSWPECGQRFSEQHDLTAHTNKHLNVRPFKCYINECVKDFRTERLLKHHIRVVHKMKPK